MRLDENHAQSHAGLIANVFDDRACAVLRTRGGTLTDGRTVSVNLDGIRFISVVYSFGN